MMGSDRPHRRWSARATSRPEPSGSSQSRITHSGRADPPSAAALVGAHRNGSPASSSMTLYRLRISSSSSTTSTSPSTMSSLLVVPFDEDVTDRCVGYAAAQRSPAPRRRGRASWPAVPGVVDQPTDAQTWLKLGVQYTSIRTNRQNYG